MPASKGIQELSFFVFSIPLQTFDLKPYCLSWCTMEIKKPCVQIDHSCLTAFLLCCSENCQHQWAVRLQYLSDVANVPPGWARKMSKKRHKKSRHRTPSPEREDEKSAQVSFINHLQTLALTCLFPCFSLVNFTNYTVHLITTLFSKTNKQKNLRSVKLKFLIANDQHFLRYCGRCLGYQ